MNITFTFGKRFLASALVGAGIIVGANADVMTLTWNGGTDGTWDATTVNWLYGETATNWVDGADAYFATDAANIAVGRGALKVRNISVASSVETKPVITGKDTETDPGGNCVEGGRGLSYDTYMPQNTNTWSVIFTNRKLSTITGIGAAYINKTSSGNSGNGRGYGWTYDAESDTAEVEIQPYKYSATQMVCTKMAFRQNGANIEARLVGSDYTARSGYDDPNYHATFFKLGRRDPAKTLYQVKNIRATSRGSELKFAYEGGFVKASGLTVAAKVFDGDKDTTKAPIEGTRTTAWSNYLTDDWQVIWQNRKLSNISGLTYAYTDKVSDNTGTKHACQGYFYEYDAETDTASVQFQPDIFNETQMVGCNVEFRQSGDDIEARVVAADYAGQRTIGTDGYHARVTMAHGYTSSYMSVKEIYAVEGADHIVVDGCGETQNADTKIRAQDAEPTIIWKDVRLSDLVAVEGTHSSAGGDLDDVPVAFTNDGTKATVQLQKYCNVQTATSDGLITYMNLTFTQVGNDIAVKVDYSRYRWYNKTSLTTDPLIFPDTRLPTKGTDISTSSDYYTMPQSLTGFFKPVKIAARIEGIRRVPDFINSGFEFTGESMGTNTFEFAWAFDADNKYVPFGFSNGATANFAADTANAIAGPVTLTGNVSFGFGDNATFEVGSADFTGLTTLTVPADLGAAQLKVGQALTKDELKKISAPGKRAKQDDDGYIYLADIKGLVIIIK